jgi:FAD/FMN-containing dehydrogenase
MSLTIDGTILTATDPGYDDARRVFPGHIGAHPTLIARVSGPEDIARVIAYAREQELPLAIRGGGHGLAGHGVSDGVVIDLSALRSLAIDTERRTAWAGAGLSTGDYTAAVGEHGLATGFGDTGTVGIGGITLAGGIGYLVRRHGMTIDNLLAAEIVTADGQRRRVDAEREPELFWALRGGGGNFGVVTRLKYRLHPVGTVFGGPLVLPATPAVIAGFVAAAAAAPEELSAIATVMNAPPMPFLPEAVHGTPVVLATIVSADERALQPFRALAAPIADLIRPQPYPELFAESRPDHRLGIAARTMFAHNVTEGQAQAIFERLGQTAAPLAACEIRVLGGALARVPADATAFAHRSRRIMINVVAMHDPGAAREQHLAWVRGLADALDDGAPGAYVGFLSDEGEAGVRAAYPGETGERLAAVKAQYDPDNVFRHNHNVARGVLT